MKFTQRRDWFVTAGILWAAGLLHASPIDDFRLGPYEVIRPVKAILLNESGETVGEMPTNVYNGEGLTDRNPLHAMHTSESSTMWGAAFDTSAGPMTIQFDLGNSYNVSEMWLWQYNGEGELDRGIRQLEIVFRDEEGAIVGNTISTGLNIGTGRPLAGTYFCPIANCVRFVELRILDNFGDSQLVGLSEIALAGRMKTTSVPELSAFPVMALVWGWMAHWIRRRRVGLGRSSER
jgi:hypothetical protein